MLKGKCAVVTGSTSGISARHRPRAGAGRRQRDDQRLRRSGRDREGACRRCNREFGVKAIYSPADMSKPAEIAGMIQTAEKTLGSVDILVSNAGIQYVAPIEDFPIEKWDQIIAINLSSAFALRCGPRPRHEGAQMGAHHLDRLGALAGGLAFQGRPMCHGQTRHRRTHQDGGT